MKEKNSFLNKSPISSSSTMVSFSKSNLKNGEKTKMWSPCQNKNPTKLVKTTILEFNNKGNSILDKYSVKDKEYNFREFTRQKNSPENISQRIKDFSNGMKSPDRFFFKEIEKSKQYSIQFDNMKTFNYSTNLLQKFKNISKIKKFSDDYYSGKISLKNNTNNFVNVRERIKDYTSYFEKKGVDVRFLRDEIKNFK